VSSPYDSDRHHFPEVFAVTKGKWKEKVNKRFAELAQVEYETKLGETETGRKYLQSKPEWGMAHWLERSRGLWLWGKRAALCRLFQFQCNGHHLGSGTSRHGAKRARGLGGNPGGGGKQAGGADTPTPLVPIRGRAAHEVLLRLPVPLILSG
jgi:hypothetical protein